MSGRRSDRVCTDELRRIDVRELARGAAFAPQGWPAVVAACDGQRFVIGLDWTACTYGGARPWWRCPCCLRRVAVLYVGRGALACRHCHRLAYRCQREADDDRALRRAEALRRRLGWRPGIAHGHGARPKRMHARTYWRMQARHDASVNQVMAGTVVRLRRVVGVG